MDPWVRRNGCSVFPLTAVKSAAAGQSTICFCHLDLPVQINWLHLSKMSGSKKNFLCRWAVDGLLAMWTCEALIRRYFALRASTLRGGGVLRHRSSPLTGPRTRKTARLVLSLPASTTGDSNVLEGIEKISSNRNMAHWVQRNSLKLSQMSRSL